MGTFLKKYFALVALATVFAGCGQRAAFDYKAQTEAFAQKVIWNNKVDVVWVVDNSSSMAQHQAKLAPQMGAFIDKLVQAGLDFHIAVTTTDMSASGEKGAFIGGSYKVITLATPNMRQELANNVILAGENGSTVERGLEGAKYALSTSMLSGPNAGFYRPDALLAVMVLSDEEDSSAGTSASYLSFFDSLKPQLHQGQRTWFFNFIGVTQLDGNCMTYNNYASVGYRYMDLVTASNGVSSTICTGDFTGAVTNLRARIVEMLTEYKLKFDPDLSTIKVTINGVVIPEDDHNGWSFDRDGWIIRFHGTGVPPIDANVNIDYKPKNSN